ncbi:Site-specific DNA recombinase [Paraburkholderia diazotrophica]|uniref:Site-specific DNA recombinase n=1 Tax=Paraburkholderia diazotrophica TaxID=667676 RepID=A0A1H7D4T1_9BURK|nr:Site-specific DNA recombinase [Paraburkholderia diazotrophica]
MHSPTAVADVGVRLRAAQYVRMSTDHQQYSPENQKTAIAAYARDHDIDIVETYEDDGRSGVTLRNRPALMKLLKDVLDQTRLFDAVLVYDISRWGRFQDVDESAYHEYLCRQAGVKVIYCAEPFANDGSPTSNIIKTIKRAMAGEFSRELSEKVFIGQSRHVEHGFWQGSPPGYGLRRMLVDANRQPKGCLRFAEHKSIQTDHVVLVPGPPNEVALVREIFHWYVDDKLGIYRIAARLNAFGLYNGYGRPWSNATIHELLRNEKYVGNMIWNRCSQKLHGIYVRNPPSHWLRTDGAFEPIVDQQIFNAAQARLRRYQSKVDTPELLASICRLLHETGQLSVREIKNRLDIPGKSRARHRIASLETLYRSVGYFPAFDIAYVDHRIQAKKTMAQRVSGLIAQLEESGHHVEHNAKLSVLCINHELRIKVSVTLGRKENTLQPYAVATKSQRYPADLVLVGYFPRPRLSLECFYLLPEGVLEDRFETTLCHSRVPGVDGFRMHDLSALLTLCARTTIEALHESPDDNEYR